MKCNDFEVCSMNSDAKCFKGTVKSAKKKLDKKPKLCDSCVYRWRRKQRGRVGSILPLTVCVWHVALTEFN